MRTLSLLSVLFLASCKSIGYYPLYDEPSTYMDFMNHGIHCPCEDYEMVSFTVQVPGYPKYEVKGDNIPLCYRMMIDTTGMCPDGCTLYMSDVVFKRPDGEIISSKRKFYMDILADE